MPTPRRRSSRRSWSTSSPRPGRWLEEAKMTINVNPPTKPGPPGLSAAAIVRRSASAAPPAPVQMEPVAKLIDVSKCIGCKACQAACMEWNDTHQPIGEFNGTYEDPHDLTETQFTLMRFTEWINPKTDTLEWLIRKDGCMHCAEPGCLKACPAPGAIVQYENGIVDFQQENCIGCGYCIAGCPFNIPRMSKKTKKVYKCTLCVDRVSVGLEPACIKACPTNCLTFGDKDVLLEKAEKRVKQLKLAGFMDAGTYNPPGVGGTGVVSVLAFASNPGAYGLPKDPRIPILVELWKSPLKWIGNFAIVAGIIGTFVHYLRFGPKHVPEDAQAQANSAGA